MNFDVVATEPFIRKLKRLSKKYKSISTDLAPIVDSLSKNPTQGTAIGKDCYKIRIAITNKGKGKSGGARLITYIRFVKNTIFLMDIYDKSDKESISPKELKMILDMLSQE